MKAILATCVNIIIFVKSSSQWVLLLNKKEISFKQSLKTNKPTIVLNKTIPKYPIDSALVLSS